MSSQVHVRKDDMVEVIAGDDAEKGRAHKVLRVLPDAGKVVVEGVNRVYKHVKPNRRNPQGGRLSKEMPVDASNVLLFCPTCRGGSIRASRRSARPWTTIWADSAASGSRRRGGPTTPTSSGPSLTPCAWRTFIGRQSNKSLV